MKGLLKRVERAEDGFCVSFDPNDPNALAHMAEFGFCVVKVLSPAECAATRAEFFHEVNVRTKAMGKEVPVDPADPSTWEDANWPCGKRLVDFPAVSQCALANRTHPNLYQFYRHLLGTAHVAGNVDVWGVMRGTAMLPGGMPDRPEWRKQLPPHWDVNPWWYVEEISAGRPRMYQGVLALVDCPDETGGLCVAPGSCASLSAWCDAVPVSHASRANHYDLPPSDPWASCLQHVPIREGEMAVWDSGSLHANFPNHGPAMRLVQYVRCSTRECADTDRLRAAHMPETNAERYGVDLKKLLYSSKLSRQMMGVVPY